MNTVPVPAPTAPTQAATPAVAGFQPGMPAVRAGKELYARDLRSEADTADWIREGTPVLRHSDTGMRLSNGMDSSAGQAANYLLWCPQRFPADAIFRWTFRPLAEPGLAMCWFCARGHQGRDLFDPALPKRTGEYRQYHGGAMDAYHQSYFRRKNQGERAFHTCNLRKSHGFYLVAQGADPIPNVEDVQQPYQIELISFQGWVRFSVDGLSVLQWHDDGSIGGPAFREGGYFGMRQMAPLVADYAEFSVHTALPA